MIFNLLSRFWIAVIKSLRHMPVSARSALAGFLALLFWIAIPKRRRVTLTNLRLCFPNKTDAERKKIAKSFYRKLMRAALDHGVLWSGTREEVAAMVRFEGVENITETVARGEHLIVISPHFVGLDAAGIGLNLHVRGCSLYQKQANPVWDEAALKGRLRFADPELIAKHGRGDLKAVIRAMNKGLPFYYLPDMDHGPEELHFHSVFRCAGSNRADGLSFGEAYAGESVHVYCRDDGRGLHGSYFACLGELSDRRCRSRYSTYHGRTRKVDSQTAGSVPLVASTL